MLQVHERLSSEAAKFVDIRVCRPLDKVRQWTKPPAYAEFDALIDAGLKPEIPVAH